MAKLSLVDRIKFYLEKGIWLEKGEEMYELMRIGINVYLDKKTSSAWIVEAGGDGTKKITKISDEGRRAFHFNIFNQERGSIYFIGTEGLFRKSSKTETIQKIYGGKNTGAIVMPKYGVIVLYQEYNDVILQLAPNNGGITKEMICKVISTARVVNELQRKTFGSSRDRRITVKKIEGYYTYTIGIQESGLHEEARLEASEVEKLLKEE